MLVGLTAGPASPGHGAGNPDTLGILVAKGHRQHRSDNHPDRMAWLDDTGNDHRHMSCITVMRVYHVKPEIMLDWPGGGNYARRWDTQESRDGQ
jgi:hypothetical protein